MDSFNVYVTELNGQVPIETTIYDANYSWTTTTSSTVNVVDTNATTSSSTINTTETQTPTLEGGNDINVRIEKIKKKAMTEYLLLTASLGLVAYYVFKNK